NHYSSYRSGHPGRDASRLGRHGRAGWPGAGVAVGGAARDRSVGGGGAVAGRCPAADDVALLVDELVANAVEHTRSGKGGEVRVTVAAAPGEWVLLLVGDDGTDD